VQHITFEEPLEHQKQHLISLLFIVHCSRVCDQQLLLLLFR